VKYVLAGSGHIAGVINPPSPQKYQYWIGGPPTGSLETWLHKAEEKPGSWWPDWVAWIKQQDPSEVPARTPGEGALKPIEDAPGRYVKVRD
jgi:polyhydroxyalkanoate synthase